MLGLNYILPYQHQRRNIGSGAGVPLILKEKGLKEGQGLNEHTYNMVMKERNEWLTPCQLKANLEQCFDEIAGKPNRFILTKFNLGPEAINNQAITDLLTMSRPDNVALCGSYQAYIEQTYFVGTILDLRGVNKGKSVPGLDEKLTTLSQRFNSPAWIANNEDTIKGVEKFQIKAFEPDFENDGKIAQRLLDFELLQLANACVILADSGTQSDRFNQILHWCQLYEIGVRKINLESA
ncbi:hypothetical protein [uncultured Photobacterium sp.]|uniref:hypothetical protein n=1 Tax=uncultured Photobacterium sp. TaxID=173973 RepID=UPI0026346EF2|nr:hypothetical protein [uncultured Photobacterium sp.]